jgi:hypothetical protein
MDTCDIYSALTLEFFRFSRHSASNVELLSTAPQSKPHKSSPTSVAQMKSRQTTVDVGTDSLQA